MTVMALEHDGWIECGTKECRGSKLARVINFIGKQILIEIRCRKCKSLNRYERPNPITGT